MSLYYCSICEILKDADYVGCYENPKAPDSYDTLCEDCYEENIDED